MHRVADGGIEEGFIDPLGNARFPYHLVGFIDPHGKGTPTVWLWRWGSYPSSDEGGCSCPCSNAGQRKIRYG